MVVRTTTFVVEVTARSSADPATLFSMVADGATWSDWAGPLVAQSRMERLGDPEPGGIGGVRKLGRAPVFLREETIGYEQDRRHEYALRTPGPMRDYRGEVRLVPLDAGGTEVIWRCQFSERIPRTGPLLAAGVRLLIRSIANRLVRAAER